MKPHLLFMVLITFACATGVNAQIKFLEECFVGGVTVTGAGNRGVNMGVKADIRWESQFTIRTIFAVTYRQGWIAPHSMYVNGGEVHWNLSSQAGPETPLSNPLSHPFAVHVRDVTETVLINDSVVTIDFPPQQGSTITSNWGWWSIYLVVLYEAPELDQEVCVRLYTADQRQDMMQNYLIDIPEFEPESAFLLSTFGSNIANFDNSGSTIWFNGDTLGEVVGNDPTNPPTLGVQGHFFYENSVAQGLNGDTVNESFGKHDAISLLNNLILENQPQLLQIKQSFPLGDSGSNPHPAFTLAYTPSCPVTSSDAMPRSYSLCRGDTLLLEGIEGFGHYAWSPDLQLSDSTAMNPVCIPDSSRWYRLRMWNDDPAQGCPLTIPVWVEVQQRPAPATVSTFNSSCGGSSGSLQLGPLGGPAPHSVSLNGLEQEGLSFSGLPASSYQVHVTDSLGCTWQQDFSIEEIDNQRAEFTANPLEGEAPLSVAFSNQSQNTNSYLWLANEELIGQSTHLNHTFQDTGTYAVGLIAWANDPRCGDTAVVVIRVFQGFTLIVPNIFTPNGDGYNDALMATAEGVEQLDWEVFNRWGQALYSGSSKGAAQVLLWDGTHRNEPAPEGSYYIVLRARGTEGRSEEMQMGVSLMR